MTGNGSSDAPAALRIARHVLDRAAVPRDDAAPAVVGAALQRVCTRVSENLRDAIGVAGYDALLARAIARAEPTNSALKDVCRRADGDIQVNIVLATVEAHGAAAITAAVEALLAALIDILSRLIGEDMAIRLIDQDVPRSGSGGGASAP